MHRHALINIVVRDLDLARKLHVVVREFTNLHVINTESLLFLSSTQTECRQEFADKVKCAQIRQVPTKEYAPPANESASW